MFIIVIASTKEPGGQLQSLLIGTFSYWDIFFLIYYSHCVGTT